MKNPDSRHLSTHDISFHLASSDKELMEKVTSIMKRTGHLSFSDSMGREHYIVDGRMGIPNLSQNIDRVSQKLSDKNRIISARSSKYNEPAVDQVMELTGIMHHLKGFRYIKYTLNRLMVDESLISPISKTIYPDLAKRFQCSILQVERDVRYAVTKATFDDKKRSPKSLICLMLDIAKGIVFEMEQNDLNKAN